MSKFNQPGKHGRLRPSDLRLKHQCTKCGAWHAAHALPWGNPLAFLITGFCPHCESSYLSLRQGTSEGIGPAAQQLVEHFGQVGMIGARN